MSEDVIETAGRYRVRLEIDQSPTNPRMEFDHLTNVITLKGQRYIDVDKNGGPLQYGWAYFAGRDNAVDLFIRWARMAHGVVAIEDNPVDGARSIWYLMPEKAAETTWEPERVIESDIQEYRSWAEGDVYGYIIEKSVTWVPKSGEIEDDDDIPDEMTTWETVEDCWGYIGHEYAEESAKEAFAPYKEESGANEAK